MGNTQVQCERRDSNPDRLLYRNLNPANSDETAADLVSRSPIPRAGSLSWHGNWFLIVLALSSCAVPGGDISRTPDASVAAAASCGAFARGAHVILEDFRIYRCPAPDVPGLTLPQFQQQPDGTVELMAYGAREGVYGFRGGRPELHVDEPCEWLDIARSVCSLE